MATQVTIDFLPSKEQEDIALLHGITVEQLETKVTELDTQADGLIEGLLNSLAGVPNGTLQSLKENYISWKLYSLAEYEDIAKDKKDTFFGMVDIINDKYDTLQGKNEEDVKAKGLIIS